MKYRFDIVHTEQKANTNVKVTTLLPSKLWISIASGFSNHTMKSRNPVLIKLACALYKIIRLAALQVQIAENVK